MTDQALSRVDKFLAGVQKPVSPGSLIFALDATASRDPTWDMAAELQAQMFREIAGYPFSWPRQSPACTECGGVLQATVRPRQARRPFNFRPRG